MDHSACQSARRRFSRLRAGLASLAFFATLACDDAHDAGPADGAAPPPLGDVGRGDLAADGSGRPSDAATAAIPDAATAEPPDVGAPSADATPHDAQTGDAQDLDGAADAMPAPDLDGGGSLVDAAFVFVDSAMLCPDGQPERRFFPDADGDGYGDVVDLSGEEVVGCEAPAGRVANAQDCDDRRAETNPSASERCNGLDDDCDGLFDNDASDERPFYRDSDGDGVGAFVGDLVFACSPPEGFSESFDDCDDSTVEVGRCEGEQFCSQVAVCLDRGECRDGSDCGPGLLCGDAGRCEPGSPCGGERYAAARVLPNLLIVLDRSCSMRARVDGVRKWQAAVEAISALTRQYEGQIRFGLSLFPDLQNPDCRQNDLILPIADGNEAAIRDVLTAALDAGDRYWPDGPCVTNIDGAMEQAAAEPRLNLAMERGFAMLVTDGEQSDCNAAGGDAGTEDIIANLNARGVPTYVVGFGGEVDADQLDDFAMLGGVARPDAPHYYQADDSAALLAAVQSIGEQVVGCDFALAEAPPNVFDLHVFFDHQEQVPHDIAHLEGWDYDVERQTVSFYGMACDRLTQGLVSDVEVVFGCPSGHEMPEP